MVSLQDTRFLFIYALGMCLKQSSPAPDGLVHFFLHAKKKKKAFTIAFLYHHRFPLNDPELLKAWMEKLPCRDWKLSRWSKLCSLHFADDCLYQLNNRTYLRQGSVPTVFSSPASKTKRSPRKRSRSQSDEAFLLCQRPKHRHRYE